MSIKLQLPKVTDLRPRITVVGVGGAGGNAVNNMIAAGLTGVDFVVANTDAQALLASSSEHRIQLGAALTEGLGAGSKPEIGEAAAEEAREEIRSHVAHAHMVFIAAGMGGGTGTGAAGVIARIAHEAGVLVVGVVTKPFQFEGARRQRIAEAGIAELKQHVDTLIVIPNQNLFRIANEKTTFAEAFVLADQVLYSGISCIVDLIVKEGLINLDFADVRTILSGMGTAMMGTGEAAGERRAILAAEEAIANPLLDEVSLRGAKGLLLSIIGGRNLTLYEVDEAASRVRQEVDPDANIIVGATFDDTLGDRVRVSIVASGMNRPDQFAEPVVARPAPPPVPRQAPPHAQQAMPAARPAPATPQAAPRPIQPQRQQVAVQQAQPSRPAAPAQPFTPAAPPGRPAPQPAAHTAEAEAEELRRRLSDAMSDAGGYEGADDEAGYGEAEANPAGAPWKAPGDVYIEEKVPQLSSAPTARQAAATPAQPQAHGAADFSPSAPNEIRRPQQRRMPDLEDFPAVGQRDYRAKAPSQPQAAPASATPAGEERRKPGLLQRLTGRGRREEPHAEPPRPAPELPREQAPAPRPPAVTAQKAPPGQTDSQPPRRAANGGQAAELPVFFGRDGK